MADARRHIEVAFVAHDLMNRPSPLMPKREPQPPPAALERNRARLAEASGAIELEPIEWS